MKKTLQFILLFVCMISCSEGIRDVSDSMSLVPAEDFLEYEIDSDSEVPIFNLYTFEDNGTEYLTFSNRHSRTILIYELLSGKFVKKVEFAGEGPNGIGQWLYGYLMTDFNHIYVPSAHKETIFLTDTTGVFKDKIIYSYTEDGLNTLRAYYNNIDNVQLTFIGDSLYIPQSLNNSLGEDKWVKESPVSVVVDMNNGKVTRFPMNHPPLLPDREVRKTLEGGVAYSQVYNGKDFVYSFTMDEKLYQVNPQTGNYETFPVKSRYLPELKFRKSPEDFAQVLKKNCETAHYGNIFYDKFRKVYYRFACPETELGANLNYLKILHTGKKEFSIMILDEEFNILGETKFPAFTYVPHICFIREDGLYISTSHFMREDYSDDLLRFQRIELVKNK